MVVDHLVGADIGKQRADADRAGGGAQPFPQPPIGALLAREAQPAPLGDVVEQDERGDLALVALCVRARAAQPARREVLAAGRLLLAVEEDEPQLRPLPVHRLECAR
ncbi:MAG: hypothetical protein M3217_07035, partial [Actinomycetota bacterium]|nr:hypothetical protein [Actinomycetota bacterium]